LNRLDDEIEGIIEARRQAVAEGKGKVAVFTDETVYESEYEDSELKTKCLMLD
jgi:hypothetical protein